MNARPVMFLRRECAYFFGALRFFTRLPVPVWVGHSQEALEHSTRYFPAVGLVVGALGALVFILASLIWPVTLAVMASMTATLTITGVFHEDGWSDMVDGFGGGWEKARILQIMKDSRIGSFGAVALAMMLIVKSMTLLEIGITLLPAALVAGHAFSRFCATLVLRFLDYARDEGKAKPLATSIGTGELVFAALCALLPLALLPPLQAIPAVLLALLATLGLARMYRRALGGYTGDCLGAVQQLSEVAFYGGLLCSFI